VTWKLKLVEVLATSDKQAFNRSIRRRPPIEAAAVLLSPPRDQHGNEDDGEGTIIDRLKVV
jgi:hypothetical protein